MDRDNRKCLVICQNETPSSLANFLLRLATARPEAQFHVASENEPAINCKNVTWAGNSGSQKYLTQQIESTFATTSITEVFVHSRSTGNPEYLGSEITISIMNQPVDHILCIDDMLQCRPYAPFDGNRADTLLVFPGPMIPLDLGSHQRAFNLVRHLNENGIYCDVLITAGAEAQLDRARNLLRSICPQVHTYRNKKRKLPKTLRLRNSAEKFWRHLHGAKSPPPERFSDRSRLRPTTSAKRTLKHLLENKQYNNIIISYAWMIDVDELITEREKYNFICDTHDVQFIRNKTANDSHRRIFYFSDYEKSAEISRLRRMHTVLAISEPDYIQLCDALGQGIVKKAYSGFDYIKMPIEERDPRTPLRFGFLGGQMEANIRALDFLFKNWWPTILSISPESKIFVAGKICETPEARQIFMLHSSTYPLGRIASLKEFYKNIDICLSPVLVQGGLNFKSVEALIAGKHLFVNELGSLCLGKASPTAIIRNSAEIEANLSEIESSPALDAQKRRQLQTQAEAEFNETHSFSEIRKLLSARGS